MENVGYIYVLTNKSFHRDNWIKIGYTDDVDKRVKELSGTAVPLPFEVYCTYEVPKINGKDPDKWLHDLIAKLNPGLRISQNREFFEMFPWDAYDMLNAIAQIHKNTEKLKRYNNNSGQDDQSDSEYSVDKLFPSNSEIHIMYEELKNLIQSLDSSLEEVPKKNYVAFKKGNNNVICLWPKLGCIEVVLGAKLEQISDNSELLYDISNRKWTASQYALKYFDKKDLSEVKEIIRQTLDSKK